MRLAVFVLTLLSVPAAFAQSEGPARQVLDACIDSLDSDVIGLEDMAEPCPGLQAALEEFGVLDFVPENQHDLLTRDGLINLRALLERYEQPPERAQLGVDGIPPVLEALREPEIERPLSWYERLKRWLRDAFGRQEEQASPWWSRWLDEHPISEAVRLVLFYSVMLLVVLLAVLIVVNEVRAARTGRRKSAEANTAGSQVASGRDPLSADSAAFGERPSALLRMLIATLVRTGRLQGAHSLTHRELLTRARFDDPAQRESFQHVAQLAEREVFSGREVAGHDLDDAVRVGRNLNAQLSGVAT